eukprot:gene1403-13558_t
MLVETSGGGKEKVRHYARLEFSPLGPAVRAVATGGADTVITPIWKVLTYMRSEYRWAPDAERMRDIYQAIKQLDHKQIPSDVLQLWEEAKAG